MKLRIGDSDEVDVILAGTGAERQPNALGKDFVCAAVVNGGIGSATCEFVVDRQAPHEFAVGPPITMTKHSRDDGIRVDTIYSLPHEDEEDTEHLDRKRRIMDAIRDYERDNR